MARQLANWLSGYAEYTSESEAPETFHLWIGLSAIASAVRRNIWKDMGFFKVFPHMYIVLVAPSGRIRKSSAMTLNQRILRGVQGVTIGPDSITREKLIRVMANAYDGKQSALTLQSSEFSSLIGPSGESIIQFLTTIYDGNYVGPEGWQYDTKGQGKDKIKDPCLNILACTTPDWIADGLPIQVTQHGFTSRIIFVYEDKVRFDNAEPKDAPKELVKALMEDLQHISLIEGQFEWGEGAREHWHKVYSEVRSEIPDDPRIASYYSRKDSHLIKVAMLLALSENDDLIISVRDLDTARGLLELTEEKMPKVFSAVGKYEFAVELERIYEQIAKNGSASIPEIYDKNYHVGPSVVAEILSSLKMMKRVDLDHSAGTVKAKESRGALGSGGIPVRQRSVMAEQLLAMLRPTVGPGAKRRSPSPAASPDQDSEGSTQASSDQD